MTTRAKLKKKAQQKGFTTLEAIVVLSVLSLLTYATIAYIEKPGKVLRDEQRFADMHTLERAFGSFKLSNGSYPKAETAIVLTGYDEISVQLVQSGAIHDIPVGPFHEKFPYAYISNHDGNHYRLFFCLEAAQVAGYTVACDNTIEH